MKNSSHLLVYIGFIWIMGLLLVLWITPYGAGVSPDSIIYIGGAKSLLAGRGYSLNSLPINHFPPLYSLFLAVMGLVTNNLVQAARILNAILFGTNMGLVGLTAYFSAGRNLFTTTLIIFFFSLSKIIVELHAWAWTEPLFITFFLSSLILLSMYIIKSTLPLIIASAICLGLAIITRYIGVAFLPAGLVIILIGEADQNHGRRFRDAVIWLVLAAAPLVISSIRNILTTGAATDRILIFHPLSILDYIYRLYDQISSFIFPISFPHGVNLVFTCLIIVSLLVISIIVIRRHTKDKNWKSMSIVVSLSCLLFSIFYLFFLFISISFFDAYIPVDSRLLSPVLILLTLGTFSMMWTITQMFQKPVVWLSFLIITGLVISIRTPDVMHFIRKIQDNGLMFTSKQWRASESVAFVKLLNRDMTIYSNGPDALGFLTDNVVLFPPYKYDPNTTAENPLYQDKLEKMCKDISENGAILVYFNSIYRSYLPTQEQLDSTCRLPILRRFADGIVYGKGY